MNTPATHDEQHPPPTMNKTAHKLLPYHTPDVVEAGCDEAGRGCLAGPVFAAAVVLPRGFSHPLLNDSKQLTARQRDTLRQVIEQEAVAWAVAECSPKEIDELNILRCSLMAMQRAVEALSVKPAHLIIDGNRWSAYPIPAHTIVRGDATYMSIAAASILAKTHRDERMLALDKDYPAYGWASNKGYPSPSHREAIRRYGVTPHHRLTFRLLPDDGQLDLFAD